MVFKSPAECWTTRAGGILNTASTLHFATFSVCFIRFSYVFTPWIYTIPSHCVFHTLPSVHNCKSSCLWLSSQCLMVCCSLWPLAVCLCTPCTCPSLTSNSTTHIHSGSHSLSHTHKNAQTHTCLALIHTLICLTHKPNWIPPFRPNKLLTLVFSSSCVPHFFIVLTAGQNIVQSPPPWNSHHPSRCIVPFRISVWARGNVIVIPPIAVYQSPTRAGRMPRSVSDRLAFNMSLFSTRMNLHTTGGLNIHTMVI